MFTDIHVVIITFCNQGKVFEIPFNDVTVIFKDGRQKVGIEKTKGLLDPSGQGNIHVTFQECFDEQ